MRVRLGVLAIAGTLALAACGPSTTLEPGDETTSDSASTGNAAVDDDGTPGNSATGTPSTSGRTTDASSDVTGDRETDSSGGTIDETGSVDWPPEGNGEWLCTGFEDPIFLTLEVADDGTVNGTACVPGLEVADPPQWKYCGELSPHVNVFGTPIYFAATIYFSEYPNGQLMLEMGLAYDAETDTLSGPIAANTVLTTETCQRWAP